MEREVANDKKKKTEKEMVDELMREEKKDHFITQLERTLRTLSHLSSSSLLLYSLLNSRKRPSPHSQMVELLKPKEGRRELLLSLRDLLKKWNQYLFWVNDSLKILLFLVKKRQIEFLSQSQLLPIYDVLSSLQSILSLIDDLLNFSIITNRMIKRVFGLATGKLGILIWTAALCFLLWNWNEVWPTLEKQMNSLGEILGDAMTFLRGPVIESITEFIEDLEHTNPGFYSKIKNRFRAVEQMTSTPKLLASKTADLSKFTEEKLKKMNPVAEQYLPSPLHTIFSKSFDALRGSRSQELPDNWTQDLTSSLTKYLGWNKSQKPKSKL